MSEPEDEFEFFFEKSWSDGLPVIPPTEARIERLLGGTSRGANEPVGEIPPAFEAASVRDIAVHAVMAGCKPEYLPVVLAGVEAMLQEPFNINGIQATMHAVAPLMIVNGPYAKKIGINGGLGCFGPGFRANATIGRAIRLVLLNLGGGIPQITSMSTFSQPSRFTFCIRENEDESPGARFPKRSASDRMKMSLPSPPSRTPSLYLTTRAGTRSATLLPRPTRWPTWEAGTTGRARI